MNISLEEKKWLLDIKEAADSIDLHLESKRIFEDYLSSKTKRRAVEREFEIIGEAMNKLLQINPAIQISFSRMIVDLRNKVIHAYDSVDDTIIWKIIMKDLPILKSEIEELLDS